MKKLAPLSLLIALILALAACDGAITQVVPVQSIDIQYDGKTYAEDEPLTFTTSDKNFQLVPIIIPQNATNTQASWISNNQKVASVSSTGYVNILGIGEATITVSIDNVSASVKVIVSEPDVAPTGITLDQTTATLEVDETTTLIATVTPENATDKTVIWTSSDTSVTTVDNEGKVTAVGAGEATITASVDGYDEVKATCTVTVKEKTVPVSGITISGEDSVLINKTITLTAAVSPADATDKTVTWTSSDESIATVEGGIVSGIKAGTVTITAAAGEVTATHSITVIDNTPTGISLDNTTLTLVPNGTQKLTATISPENAEAVTLDWSSSDEKVATVSNDGTVTAVAPGNATITVKMDGHDFSATCAVTVNPIAVTGITLDQTTATLEVDETTTLIATVTPEEATTKTVTWTSSDTSVATVEGGVVTAVKAGETTITASVDGYDEVKATCTVTVKAKTVPVSEIKISGEDSVLINKTITLTAAVSPADATDKTVTWTSSDESIATVEGGIVSGIKAGTVTITAAAGEVTATHSIIVIDNTPTGISLDNTTLSLVPNGTQKLTATITPDNAEAVKLVWSSSDEKVATVSDDGTVTAVAPGSATITVKMDGHDFSATCAVTVNPIAVTGITLDQTSETLTVGGTTTLTATVSPSDATNKTVTWSSSDDSIASVDKGLVTGVSDGTATITAKAGDKTATCTITVNSVPATGITLDTTEFHLSVNETQALNASIVPDNTTDKSVAWVSSNTDIATVDNEGKVTAVGAGEAKITATTSNNLVATATVTVYDADMENLGTGSLDFTGFTGTYVGTTDGHITYLNIMDSGDITMTDIFNEGSSLLSNYSLDNLYMQRGNRKDKLILIFKGNSVNEDTSASFSYVDTYDFALVDEQLSLSYVHSTDIEESSEYRETISATRYEKVTDIGTGATKISDLEFIKSLAGYYVGTYSNGGNTYRINVDIKEDGTVSATNYDGSYSSQDLDALYGTISIVSGKSYGSINNVMFTSSAMTDRKYTFYSVNKTDTGITGQVSMYAEDGSRITQNSFSIAPPVTVAPPSWARGTFVSDIIITEETSTEGKTTSDATRLYLETGENVFSIIGEDIVEGNCSYVSFVDGIKMGYVSVDVQETTDSSYTLELSTEGQDGTTMKQKYVITNPDNNTINFTTYVDSIQKYSLNMTEYTGELPAESYDSDWVATEATITPDSEFVGVYKYTNPEIDTASTFANVTSENIVITSYILGDNDQPTYVHYDFSEIVGTISDYSRYTKDGGYRITLNFAENTTINYKAYLPETVSLVKDGECMILQIVYPSGAIELYKMIAATKEEIPTSTSIMAILSAQSGSSSDTTTTN